MRLNIPIYINDLSLVICESVVIRLLILYFSIFILITTAINFIEIGSDTVASVVVAAVPAVPSVPSVPAVPSVPSVPAVPAVPAAYNVASIRFI